MEWLLIILAAGLYWLFKNFKMDSGPVVPADAVAVVSRSSGETYHVSLEQLSCTCPDWQKRRGQFNKDDPRRLCKHLVQYCIGQDKLPKSLSLYQEALEWFYKRGWKIPADKKIVKLDSPHGEIAYFKDREDDIWYSVCFQGKRYGWEKSGNVWAHGTPIEVQDIVFRSVHGIPDDLPVDAISTVEETQLDDPMKWIIAGQVEGEKISAEVSLRANTVNSKIKFNGDSFNFHSENREVSKRKYIHLMPALSKWIRAEKEKLRDELKKK